MILMANSKGLLGESFNFSSYCFSEKTFETNLYNLMLTLTCLKVQYWLQQLALELEERLTKDRDVVSTSFHVCLTALLLVSYLFFLEDLSSCRMVGWQSC